MGIKNEIAFETLTFFIVIKFDFKCWHSFRTPRSKRDADTNDGSGEELDDDDYYYDDENE